LKRRLGGAPSSSRVGFDAQSIVHRDPELLLASKIALRCPDRDVTEKELDLIQFAAGKVAKTCAGTMQVVWRELVDARASCSRADDIPAAFAVV
jgi:hypothetical protein